MGQPNGCPFFERAKNEEWLPRQGFELEASCGRERSGVPGEPGFGSLGATRGPAAEIPSRMPSGAKAKGGPQRQDAAQSWLPPRDSNPDMLIQSPKLGILSLGNDSKS